MAIVRRLVFIKCSYCISSILRVGLGSTTKAREVLTNGAGFGNSTLVTYNFGGDFKSASFSEFRIVFGELRI